MGCPIYFQIVIFHCVHRLGSKLQEVFRFEMAIGIFPSLMVAGVAAVNFMAKV